MPSETAESISKHSFGDIPQRFYNMSNVTHLTEGPEIDRIREQQFYILLPSFVYTFILMFLGLPGNLTVIIVYALKMAKTTSRHFIISLAVCDFINCAFGMPVELSLLTNFYNFDFPILCKISRFMTFFMNNTSSCVLIGIAVDRFRRVCLPLRPNMTVKQSRTICITVTFISMLSAAPSLYIYGTRTILLPGPRNDTLLVMKTCYIDDGVETRIPLIFNLYMFIFVILMFLCLIIMYSCVGRTICTKTGFSEDRFRKTRNKSSTKFLKSRFDGTRLSTVFRSFSERSSPRIHKANRKSPDEERNLPDIIEPLSAQQRAHSDTSVRRHGGKEIRAGRTTMILFIVSLIFVLSFVPYLAIVTMRYINKEMVAYMSPAQLTIYNLTLRSYLLNSAVNPIVYCFLNRQFRMKVSLFCQSIFCQCRNRKKTDQGHSRQVLQVH